MAGIVLCDQRIADLKGYLFANKVDLNLAQSTIVIENMKDTLYKTFPWMEKQLYAVTFNNLANVYLSFKLRSFWDTGGTRVKESGVSCQIQGH